MLHAMAPAPVAPRGDPTAARAAPTAGAPSVADATLLFVAAEEASKPHRLNKYYTLAAHSDLTVNTDSIVGGRALMLNALGSTIGSTIAGTAVPRASSTLCESAPIPTILFRPCRQQPVCSRLGRGARDHRGLRYLVASQLLRGLGDALTAQRLLSGLDGGLGQRHLGQCHSIRSRR